LTDPAKPEKWPFGMSTYVYVRWVAQWLYVLPGSFVVCFDWIWLLWAAAAYQNNVPWFVRFLAVCPKVRRVNQVMQRPYFRSSYINSPSGTKWRPLHNQVFSIDLFLIVAHPAVLYPVIMDGYKRWQVLVLLLVPHYYYYEHYFWFLDQELIPYRYSSCSFCPFSLVGGNLFKKGWGATFEIGSGWNFDKIASVESRNFWYHVILSRWRPWRHFMWKSAAICARWADTLCHLVAVCLLNAHCCIGIVSVAAASNSVYSSWSIVH